MTGTGSQQTSAQREHAGLKSTAKCQLFIALGFTLAFGVCLMFSLLRFHSATELAQYGMIIITAVLALASLGFTIAAVRTVSML